MPDFVEYKKERATKRLNYLFNRRNQLTHQIQALNEQLGQLTSAQKEVDKEIQAKFEEYMYLEQEAHE